MWTGQMNLEFHEMLEYVDLLRGYKRFSQNSVIILSILLLFVCDSPASGLLPWIFCRILYPSRAVMTYIGESRIIL
jgi:hypothetical protein